MDVYLLGLGLGLGYHCYTDLRYMLLYDSTNCYLLFLGWVRAWQLGLMQEAWQGLVVLGILMLLVYWASRGGMGEGDVKLAAVLGLWLGVERGLLCAYCWPLSVEQYWAALYSFCSLLRDVLRCPLGPFYVQVPCSVMCLATSYWLGIINFSARSSGKLFVFVEVKKFFWEVLLWKIRKRLVGSCAG